MKSGKNLKFSLYFAVSCLSVALMQMQIDANAGNKSTSAASKSTVSAKGKKEGKAMAEIYEFKANALDGKEIKLSNYKGDVMLIVNTASKCGYTPQFDGLEALNKKFAARGLKVLGFPCNQFGAQEPGDAAEIGSFCKKNYGVDFQMFEKIDVNGEHAHPLYRYLTDGASKPIKWNFTKFLVDRNGKVVHRFESAVKPEDMAAEIEKTL